MFTGLIETVGRVESAPQGDGSLAVSCPFAGEVSVGDSVAVDGACLTAVRIGPEKLEFDLSLETAQRCAGFAAGASVNLERALPVGGRLGGHFVTGHVDGVAEVGSVVLEGENRRMRFSCPSGLLRYVVSKGCVALAGVSLTVCDVFADGFDVQLVPHTLRSTSLGEIDAGARINLEVDLLAKYVESLRREA